MPILYSRQRHFRAFTMVFYYNFLHKKKINSYLVKQITIQKPAYLIFEQKKTLYFFLFKFHTSQ